ncbi:MAG: hypothetical protein ACT4NL_01125 [Pseudomarimonas sp.]
MFDAWPDSRVWALVMLALGPLNALLMAWLWQFPMIADPASRNPHGRSSAPVAWVWLHRVIGYLFVLCLIALLLTMLPRLWRFQEWSALAVLHAGGGLAIVVILVAKLWVIRRRPHASHWLPRLGGTLAALTVAVALSGLLPRWWLDRDHARLTVEAQQGQALLKDRCLQCHGASVIIAERERPERWHRELREMQKRASRGDAFTPISDHERALIATFLIETQGKKPRGRDR